MAYEVITAKTREEALEKASFKVGEAYVCKDVTAIANTNGTYTITAVFDKGRKPCKTPKSRLLCEATRTTQDAFIRYA